MTSHQEQLIALGALFEAAVQVDRLAHTGQASTPAIACLINSLLVRNPETTLAVYGGDDLNLRDGYHALLNTLQRNPNTLQREPLRYVIALIALERQLSRRSDLLEIMASRLDQIENQVTHFGLTHDNVMAACGGLYQDTISTFRQRIQVHGDMRYLQQPGIAAKVRALLLSGIRSARLWRQLGGRRWQLLFSRGKLLKELNALMASQ